MKTDVNSQTITKIVTSAEEVRFQPFVLLLWLVCQQEYTQTTQCISNETFHGTTFFTITCMEIDENYNIHLGLVHLNILVKMLFQSFGIQ